MHLQLDSDLNQLDRKANAYLLWPSIVDVSDMAAVEELAKTCHRLRSIVIQATRPYRLDLHHLGMRYIRSCATPSMTLPEARSALTHRAHRWRTMMPKSVDVSFFHDSAFDLVFSSDEILFRERGRVMISRITGNQEEHFDNVEDEIISYDIDPIQNLVVVLQVGMQMHRTTNFPHVVGEVYLRIFAADTLTPHPHALTPCVDLGISTWENALIERGPKIMGRWCGVLYAQEMEYFLSLTDWTNPQCTLRIYAVNHGIALDFLFITETIVLVLHYKKRSSDDALGPYNISAYQLDVASIGKSPRSDLILSLALPTLHAHTELSPNARLHAGGRLPNSLGDIVIDNKSRCFEQPDLTSSILFISMSLSVPTADAFWTFNVAVDLDGLCRLIKRNSPNQSMVPWSRWGPSIGRVFHSSLPSLNLIPRYGNVHGRRVSFAIPSHYHGEDSIWSSLDPFRYRLGVLDFNATTIVWAQALMRDGIPLPGDSSLVIEPSILDPDDLLAEKCESSLPYYRSYLENTHRPQGYGITEGYFFVHSVVPLDADGRHLRTYHF
ncbi:hypothetical protein A0H81_02165 [Grifola frondosa]|uniref:Uncharacterized protein n=1 Tax=Grifola frondosa TaxID=5627 RepID=A0A1C7MNF7_GRIFR|nr:hypothetical protein A0H81_02165 [Grifola frondosa]